MGRLLNWTKTGGPPLEVNWLALVCCSHCSVKKRRAARAPRTASSCDKFQLLGLLPDHGAMGQRELGETVGVDPCILVTLLNPLGPMALESHGGGGTERETLSEGPVSDTGSPAPESRGDNSS